jgi:5'-nucleotidase
MGAAQEISTDFLTSSKISEFQKLERQKAQNMAEYTQMLRIAIVTARNAPAHERLINTLSEAGIDADELFLLGGIEKKLVLEVLKPHIFFDDQIGHLEPASLSTPSVHVPFGIANYIG